MKEKKKVELRIKSLESKVTPSCAGEIACNAMGGTWMGAEGLSINGSECWDAAGNNIGGWNQLGQLAAVADY